jgi:hypothetical protein
VFVLAYALQSDIDTKRVKYTLSIKV